VLKIKDSVCYNLHNATYYYNVLLLFVYYIIAIDGGQ